MADQTAEERRVRMPPPWPPLRPYKASETASIHAGTPDLPANLGGREFAKFRPGAEPGTDTVAVANDNGTPIGFGELSEAQQQVVLLKGILYALHLMVEESVEDLINEGNAF